jgi:hypothetical protein
VAPSRCVAKSGADQWARRFAEQRVKGWTARVRLGQEKAVSERTTAGQVEFEERTSPRADMQQAWLPARVLVIGLLCVLFLAIAGPYGHYQIKTTLFFTSYLPVGLIFPFLVVVTVVNGVLKWLRARWALTPRELLLIYIMVMVGGQPVTYGMTSYLLSIISAPYYFASPENHWAELFHQYIPDWIAPKDLQAIVWFYQGLPPGEGIPWRAWLVPLAWWLPLIGAVMVASFAIVAIMRRQWVENERLIFPLNEVPLHMVEGADDGRPWPRFCRNRVFWAGFAVSFSITCWNTVSYFYPGLGQILFDRWMDFPNFPEVRLLFSPLVIGVTYFVNLDVSFSIWFFWVLGMVQQAVFNRIGYSVGEPDCYDSINAAMAWQGFGAFVVMVVLGLWVARGHLRDVFRKAFRSAPEVDDSRELLSYRAAVWVLILSVAYIGFWMLRSGMSPLVVVMFLFTALILFLGITRCVIEGGLAFVRGPLIPQTFAIRTLGVYAISKVTMTSLAFSYAWLCDQICEFMPFAANAAHLDSSKRLGRRALLQAMAIAAPVGILVSVFYTIYLGYRHGAFNWDEWAFSGGGAQAPFENLVSKLENPFGPDTRRLAMMAIGAVVGGAIIAARYRFPGVLLHPLGFAVASVIQVTWCMLSIFLAWLIKLVIIKLGGLQLFRKARPFFIGLILGQMTGAAMVAVIDYVFFMGQGHSVIRLD